MQCPKCKKNSNKISSEKKSKKGVSLERTRICECGHKFITVERIKEISTSYPLDDTQKAVVDLLGKDKVIFKKQNVRSTWKFSRLLTYGYFRLYTNYPILEKLLKFGKKKYPKKKVAELFKHIFFKKIKNNKYVGIFKYEENNKKRVYCINAISKKESVRFFLETTNYWNKKKELFPNTVDHSNDKKKINQEAKEIYHSINTYIKKPPFNEPTIFVNAFEEDNPVLKYFNNGDFQRIFLSIL